MLDLDDQKYVGVDVTNMFLEEMYENYRVSWIHWYMCAMVLKPLLNHTTQAILFTEEFLLGNPQLISNPFQY